MIGRVGFGFISQVKRPSPELLRQLEGAASSAVTDALGRTGVMDIAIKPLKQGMTVLGPAITVDLPPGDNLMLYKALELAQPGDVLVVNTGGQQQKAIWGELMTNSAKVLQLGGLVVDGLVRDGASNRELGFPIFCRGTSPVAVEKDGPGFVNNTISCGGVVVRPGDVVVGDDDGVVVLPVEQIEAVTADLARQKEREEKRMAEILSGKALPGWLEKTMKEKGLSAGGAVKGVSE